MELKSFVIIKSNKANLLWNTTFLMGKEPGFVKEVQQVQLDIVGLTSTALVPQPKSLRRVGISSTMELPQGIHLPTIHQ